MAFPQIRSLITSDTPGADLTHVVSLPPDIVAGDTIIVNFVSDGAEVVTWPDASWNVIHDQAPSPTLSVAWRKADGSEGATITITTGSNERSSHSAYSIQNAADPAVTPPEAVPDLTNGGDQFPDPPLLSLSGGQAKDILWMAVAGMDNNNHNGRVTSFPTFYDIGQLEEASTIGSGRAAVGSACREFNSASDDPGIFTVQSSVAWATTTVAIHPGAAGPVTGTAETDLTAYLNKLNLEEFTNLTAYLNRLNVEISTLLRGFLYQEVEIDTELSAYIWKLQEIQTNLTAYLESGFIINTQLTSYLEQLNIEESTDLSAYLTAESTETILSNLSAYIQRTEEIQTNLRSYLKTINNERSSDLTAYLYFALEVSTNLTSYLKTVDNLTQPAFLRSYLQKSDLELLTNLTAYLYEAEEIQSNLTAYLIGQIGSVTDLSAYLSKIGVLQQTLLSGFLVESDRIPHVCVRASGREKFVSAGREKFKSSRDTCPNKRRIE